MQKGSHAACHHAHCAGGVAHAHGHVYGVGLDIRIVKIDLLAVQEAAACPECGVVVAGLVLVRTLFAVADLLTHNELRELDLQGVVVKTDVAQTLGTYIGDEYIGLFQQAVHDLVAAFGLKVEGDSSLVCVENIEDGVEVVLNGCTDSTGP